MLRLIFLFYVKEFEKLKRNIRCWFTIFLFINNAHLYIFMWLRISQKYISYLRSNRGKELTSFARHQLGFPFIHSFKFYFQRYLLLRVLQHVAKHVMLILIHHKYNTKDSKKLPVDVLLCVIISLNGIIKRI